jgi:toxin CcdB
MAQFTLYRNTNRQTQGRYPFLIDIQSDFLNALKTRLVIPVSQLADQKPITRLNPVFEWEGRTAIPTPRPGNGRHSGKQFGRQSYRS